MIIGISGKKQSGKDTIAKIIQSITDGDRPEKIAEIVKNDWIAADEVAEERTWIVKCFADPLKDFTCRILGCSREELEDEEFKNKGIGEMWKVFEYKDDDGNIKRRTDKDLIFDNLGEELTPRKIMQLLGTECGRSIHPDIWVNTLMREYKPTGEFNEIHDATIYPNWIIPDVRFLNEAKAIKDRGGLILRVERSKFKQIGEESKVDNTTAVGGVLDFSNYDNHPSETSMDNYLDFDGVIQNNGTIDELIDVVREFLIAYELCKTLNSGK